MNKKLVDNQLLELFKAVLLLKDVEECEAFFKDLCTINELKAMSQRLEVVKLLDENVVYHEIAKKTGASTATISRVSRSLNYGNDGYRLLLDRLNQK